MTSAVDTASGPAPVGDVAPRATSLVVCSLEPWSAVRRRIRILVDELVATDHDLDVLYVEPAVDVTHELRRGHRPTRSGPSLEQVHARIHVLHPRKWLPRVVGPFADRSLARQIRGAVDHLALTEPLLWVNDALYADFALGTGWPTLYDITDDWLLASLPPRQEARLRADEERLLSESGAVVVCSPELARTKGGHGNVELIPNGVDVELFEHPQPRPPELPRSPVAVYVGTLHDERVDVPLILELARSRTDLAVALVGPDILRASSREALTAEPSVHLLGPVPYDRVPAFFQHADVVVVPHLVNPFTESLDPIKAYECLAAGRPTVATPVAGFRDLTGPVTVADRDHFCEAVAARLDAPREVDQSPPVDVPTWQQRAESMAAVMERIRSEARAR